MKQPLTLLIACGIAGVASADPTVIYGTVTTDDDRELTGVISWDGEENYWIQHFNGRHRDPASLNGIDEAARDEILERQPGPQIDLGGLTVEFVKWFSEPELRPTDFSIEFGAIESLDVDRSRVTVTLRDGSERVADGGSNDIGADLQILDATGAEREVEWRDVERVVFAEAPAGHPTFPQQLFGVARTRHGELSGVMAWDSDERFATEMLDGDLADGEEVSLEFGVVELIESRGDESFVRTFDGGEYVLGDSNDVDRENRGLIIVSPALGRIVVDWEDFEAVTFSPLPSGFLPTRDAWSVPSKLAGRVRTDSAEQSGEILYDIDEATRFDTLDGYTGDSRLWVPFRLVSVVTPGDSGSDIQLVGGKSLKVTRDRDVNQTNNGLLVTGSAGQNYLPWDSVREVRLDTPSPPVRAAAPVEGASVASETEG